MRAISIDRPPRYELRLAYLIETEKLGEPTGNPHKFESHLVSRRIGAHMSNPFGASPFKNGENGSRARANSRDIVLSLFVL